MFKRIDPAARTLNALAAMTAEAEGKVIRHVLTELESEDPNRIETLKEQLQKNMEQANEVAVMWRNAAKK